MSARVVCHATVAVVLEVRCSSTWNPDAQIDQVFKQGREEAIQSVGTLLKGCSSIRIVGTPTVKAVASELEAP